MSKIGRIVVAMFVAMYVISFGTSVFAAPGDYSNNYYVDNKSASNPAWLSIGSSRFVEESEVNLRIYFPSKSGINYKIYGYNLCKNDGDSVYESGPKSWNFSVNSTVVDYFINTRRVAEGRYRPTSGCQAEFNTETARSSAIRPQDLTYDEATKLYYARFTARVRGSARGFVNKFNLYAGHPDVIIAPEGQMTSANNTGSAVMIEQKDNLTGVGANQYRNYTIRFGSSCEVESGDKATISFYDLDNVNAGGGRPIDAQYGKQITIKLRRYSTTNTSTWAQLERVDGKGRLIDNNTAIVPPVNENNETFSVRFTADPDYRYELLLQHVWRNNTVQYTLPYDGVYWNVRCQDPPGGGDPDPETTTVTPTLDLTSDAAGNNSIGSGTVEEGDPIYVQTRIRNSNAADARVRYRRDVWWERGTNESYQASDININRIDRTQGIGSGDTLRIDPESSPPVNRSADTSDGRRRFCAKLTVDPRSTDDVTTVVTDREITRCATIGKTPTFQAWGSDVIVGGSAANASAEHRITTVLKANNEGRLYGSWGEYGVFARGRISGFGSAATLKRGQSGPVLNRSTINRLSFANTASAGDGWYALPAGIGAIPRERIKAQSAFQRTTTSLPSGEVSGTQIYRTNGNVTISNDIRYRGTASANNLPQVVIIANNINIRSNVERIDAWLIADGEIDTCANVNDSSLTASACQNRLIINGPVMADRLKLKRGYTDRNDKAVPAEVINLRSDAYLWARDRYRDTGSSSMRTSYISELPPRY